MMKQKGHQGNANNTFPTEQPPDLPALDPNASQFWNEQPNLRNINGGNSLGNSEPSLDDGNIDVPCLVPNSPGNSGNFYSIFYLNQLLTFYVRFNFSVFSIQPTLNPLITLPWATVQVC